MIVTHSLVATLVSLSFRLQIRFILKLGSFSAVKMIPG